MSSTSDYKRLYRGIEQSYAVSKMHQIVHELGPDLTSREGLAGGQELSSSIWDDEESPKINHPCTVFADFNTIIEALRQAYIVDTGVEITVRTTGEQRKSHELGSEWIVCVDFETSLTTSSVYEDSAVTVPIPEEFSNSPLYEVAKAYQRECGWDFAPYDDGVWMLYLLPISCVHGGPEGKQRSTYTAKIIGFAVFHDRANNNQMTLSHVWTARVARRKGVASRLLEEARKLFPVTGFEGPFTESGAPFVKAMEAVK